MAQQTTLDEWARDPVDPEIRAHVHSLITAVSFCTTVSDIANMLQARWYW